MPLYGMPVILIRRAQYCHYVNMKVGPALDVSSVGGPFRIIENNLICFLLPSSPCTGSDDRSRVSSPFVENSQDCNPEC